MASVEHAARALSEGASEVHHVALDLDGFGGEAIEAASRDHGQSVQELVADACGYFALEVQDGRIATRLPRFSAPRDASHARDLELQVPSRIWATLEQEAADQGADVDRMVGHACLLYIADLNGGRAVRRMLEPERTT